MLRKLWLVAHAARRPAAKQPKVRQWLACLGQYKSLHVYYEPIIMRSDIYVYNIYTYVHMYLHESDAHAHVRAYERDYEYSCIYHKHARSCTYINLLCA